MKEYDFAFSLGFSCACSESLRAEGLQTTSLPFDWVGVSGLRQSVSIIADDFRNWFDRDLLELWDVRIAGGFVTRVYRNSKTRIGFVHEFSNADPIETCYERERLKFDRRIARFQERMKASGRILAVYLELPTKPCLPSADIVSARKTLMTKFPHAEIDLLYMYEDPDCPKWEAREVADGVTVARMDYRMFLNGEIMHTCLNGNIRACLRSLAHVPDARSEEEKNVYARKRKSRRGGWIERKLTRLFRDLESYLETQKIMPADRPLWFDGSGK